MDLCAGITSVIDQEVGHEAATNPKPVFEIGALVTAEHHVVTTSCDDQSSGVASRSSERTKAGRLDEMVR
mgnify:CR=1 FL=1